MEVKGLYEAPGSLFWLSLKPPEWDGQPSAASVLSSDNEKKRAVEAAKHMLPKDASAIGDSFKVGGDSDLEPK